MNKTLKKTLGIVLSLGMTATSVVLPTAASADEHIDVTPIFAEDSGKVIAEWKFDFGAEGQTPDAGFTAVAPDKSYYTGTDGYGFLGLDEEEYKLGNRLDGFGLQKGQKITLSAGGGTTDGIGSTGEDDFGNAGDEYYPVRFALKADDETYYRVKATVTTLDPTQDAEISLYTERKHPIYTYETVEAGTTKTVTFSVRPTPIYYEKSDPKGAIADGMVNIDVLGKNSALASIEIQQVDPYPVFWVLGDSTVTDGNTTLPFFPLQQCTGVGTGLTKYLPRNMAMVNEGEGGLSATDNYHFNMVRDRIKSGDYLYVEYGHNHKSDGTAGYLAALPKYYNLCNEKGAKLIIVSPVTRINTWNKDTQQYGDSLKEFAEAGKSYVEEKVAAGATDIPFVDLNTYSIAFLNRIVNANNKSADSVKYYYQTDKGGGTDASHPNDAGAENFAYEFITAAKAVTDTTQKAVLAGFLDNITDETPNLVKESITSTPLGGDAWPTYVVQTDNEYPVVIQDVEFGDDGSVDSVTVKTQAAKIKMEAYGIIIITIKDSEGTEKGKIYAVDQVDNSTGYGTQVITNFRGDTKLEDGDTYSAIVMKALDKEGGIVVDEEANLAYSAEYIPSDIVKQLITNEDNDGSKDFNYFGAVYEAEDASTISKLTSFNGWVHVGSGGATLTLGKTDDNTYTNIATDGVKTNSDGSTSANQGSFYLHKDFVKETVNDKEVVTDIGSSGKYLISMDLKYVSGGGMNVNLVSGISNNNLGGTQGLTLYTINSDGNLKAGDVELGQISATDFSNVQYILDMDLGKGYVSINGGTAKEIDLANYQTTELTVTPTSLTELLFTASKVAVAIQASNITVAELKRDALPEYTAAVTASDDTRGSVSISGANSTSIALGYNSETNVASVKADEAVTVYLIEAKYTGKALSEVIPTKMEFTAAGTKTQAVTAGSKLMVWKSLDGVEPVVDAITATETVALPADNEVIDTINTPVTVTAEANEGSVFMGWSDGTDIVSMDNPYTFRLRDDITLTARFVAEPVLTDVKDFKLSGNSTTMKKTVGSTVTVTAYDAVDASGTPYTKLKNNDVVWSCTETGIDVSENGVVTIGDSFSMGTADTKVITISGTLNGVTKTYDITVFGYEYYEEMTEGITSYTGEFYTYGGKTAIAFPGSKQTKVYTMTEAVSLETAATIEFDLRFDKSDAGQARTFSFKNSKGETIFSMYCEWSNLHVGDTSLGGAYNSSAWNTVSIAVDPATNVVTVTAGGNSATTALAGTVKDIAGIELSAANGCPEPSARTLGISYLKIVR